MRKTRKNRTPKEERESVTKVKFVSLKRKSRAGITYTTFKEKVTPLPVGFNHNARRQLDAIDKRQKEGREYYIFKGSSRVYVK